jgi:magnesium chelatase subunit D
MAATKRAVLAILQDAYQKRDRVALLTFRFANARIVLKPTSNMTRARQSLDEIYVGGCTPIATGLLEAVNLIEQERHHDPTLYPVLILFTDGVPNVGLNSNMSGNAPVSDALKIADLIAERRINATVIDTSLHYNPNAVKRNEPICRALAEHMQASYYVLSQLKKDSILERL